MPSHEDFQAGGTSGSVLESRDSLKRDLRLAFDELDLAFDEFRQGVMETLDALKLDLIALFWFDSTSSVESEQPDAVANDSSDLASSVESEQPDAVTDDSLQERLDSPPARTSASSAKLPRVAYRERMVTSQKGAVIVVGGFPVFVEASCFPVWRFLFPPYLAESLVPEILQLQVYVIARLHYFCLKMSRIKRQSHLEMITIFC